MEKEKNGFINQRPLHSLKASGLRSFLRKKGCWMRPAWRKGNGSAARRGNEKVSAAKKIIVLVLFYALFLGKSCAHADGEVKSLKKFQFWNTGKVRQCDVYDVNGYLKAKVYCYSDGAIEKIERFNMLDKKTEEALYDGHGKIKTGIDGWAAKRWLYSGPTLLYEVAYDET